ncbi:MAG: hydrogenase nickel incorporation protein HypB [Planctomycetes bacterium]|nr:hydrogenase nickel incorporation protein HypB [Planctomycetota bacterium]
MKIKLARDVLESNDRIAREVRDLLSKRGILSVNILSSPGAGKTTILEHTIRDLGGGIRAAVIEGDLQGTIDAERIDALGVPVVQLNTEGGCHLTAGMVRDALEDLPLDRIDLLFIENVGNLVCPASFDIGESRRVVILSVPEGHDKPAKYPPVFATANALLLNKIDLLPHVAFDMEFLRASLARLNADLPVFEVVATVGRGFAPWLDWLRDGIRAAKEG